MKEEKRSIQRIWQLYKEGGLPPAFASVFNPQSAQQMAYIRSIMRDQRQKTELKIHLEQLEVVVFDLETTGFSPYHGDEILSIGAVSAVGEQIDENRTYYSVICTDKEIPTAIEQLTGISNESARSAPKLIDVLHNFLTFVKHRVLIAHGTGHDKHFLNSALWKTSKINFTHRIIDSMQVAKWLNPNLNGYDLDSLLNYYGIPIMNRHHALNDAIMTAQLWRFFVKEALQRNVITMGDLYEQLSKH